MAAEYGHTEIVKFLLQHGADPNTCSTYGNSAMMLAINRNHSEIVKLLKAAGGKLSGIHQLAITEGVKFAQDFVDALTSSRDFAPLIDQYFVKSFPNDCPTTHQGFTLLSIDSAPFEPELLKQIDSATLRRYTVAQLNCTYLSLLYRISAFDTDELDDVDIEKQSDKIYQDIHADSERQYLPAHAPAAENNHRIERPDRYL